MERLLKNAKIDGNELIRVNSELTYYYEYEQRLKDDGATADELLHLKESLGKEGTTTVAHKQTVDSVILVF